MYLDQVVCAYIPKKSTNLLIYKFNLSDVKSIKESLLVKHRLPMDVIEIEFKDNRKKVVLAWGDDTLLMRGLWKKVLGIVGGQRISDEK